MADQTRIKTKEGYLVDDLHNSPVDDYEYRFRTLLVCIPLLVLFALLLWLIWQFSRDSTSAHADIREHFKYGSIGSEPGGRLLDPVGGVLPPYWVFRTLPSVCPEKLPGGYASLGLIYEPGHDLPIGLSRRHRLGLEQVGLNCAVCHTGTVRASAGEQAAIVLGMPAHQFDIQRLFEFVLDCSLDERLTANNVFAKAEEIGGHVPWFERQLYRLTVIEQVKAKTLQLRNLIGPLLGGAVPAWGPGRVDTFNPYKAIQFHWALNQLPHDELIGASDFPSLWNQTPRQGLHLHWDGNNTSVDERNLSASLGAGVTPVTVDFVSLERIHNWIWDLPPPTYPFAIDSSLAARGQTIYQQSCAECHAFNAARNGHITNIADIGTDPYRFNSYTYTFAVSQASLYPQSRYRFKEFRKTNGYANQPLDGVWARAPYLHNGSVPTMRDLLESPEQRPARFYRGYDVYDQERMGFVSSGPAGSLYDAGLPGNGNGGHLYGTKLPEQDKRSLIEYMKTL